MGTVFPIVIPPILGNIKLDEALLIKELFDTYNAKRTRNLLRSNYYNGMNRLKDLGIAIPPQLRQTATVVGWPAKAVDVLAARSMFDGFTTKEGSLGELDSIVLENGLPYLYAEILPSELTHSCAFLTVSRGSEGEPKAIISAYSALEAAALWDKRKKRIKAGMTVVDVGEDDNLRAFNLYKDEETVEFQKSGIHWVRTAHAHLQGRPLMEPLRFQPTVDRPMGKSRISRAVMSLTDSAVRAALRAEVSAEFYTTPMRYFLGASDEGLDKVAENRWEATIGTWFLASRGGDGEKPEIGQFPQMSMQPHIEYMRSLASQFAGETDIPIGSLGIIHDNPASAEAIYAVKEDLIIKAEQLNAMNGLGLRNIGLLALAITQNKSVNDLDENLMTMMPVFKRPNRPSVVSQSDAMIKQASAAPWIGETEVFLEELGYDTAKRARLVNERRMAEGRRTLDEALEKAQGAGRGRL